MELQNHYVDLILSIILKELKQGKDNVGFAVDVMTDLSITNEVLKEHLMGLSMDPKLAQEFEKLDTQVKSAFTRSYNQKNSSNTTGVVKKTGGGGRGIKNVSKKDQSEGSDLDEDEDQTYESEGDAGAAMGEEEMLDEEQIMELKKGKILDKLAG